MDCRKALNGKSTDTSFPACFFSQKWSAPMYVAIFPRVFSRVLCSTAVALAILAAAAAQARAASLYASSLTAPPLNAGNLVGQDGWAAHSGAGSVPIQVSNSGTLVDSNGGGAREDASVAFTPIATGQTYYFGFDVLVNGAAGVDPTTVYFAHFKDAGTDFTTRTFVTPFAGSDFTFGLSPSGSAPNVTWATGLSYGQTYRVVGSYANDTFETRLWVDPVTELSTSIAATDSAAAAVSSFALRQASANNSQLITNLAVGTSFADVVNPVPEPSALGLAAAGFGLLAAARRRRAV